jgi:hypothetical protein
MDPAGGDIECWTGPSGEPGLIRMASQVRYGTAPDGIVEAVAVPVGPGAQGVLAPTAGDRAEATLLATGDRLCGVLPHTEGLVGVDGGRWSRSQVTARRLAGCDVVAVVVAPTVASIEHARWLVRPLVEMFRVPVVAISVGEHPYPPSEVAGVLGVRMVGVLPWDRRGVRMLLGASSSRMWSRTALARAARGVLGQLDEVRAGELMADG